MPVAPPNKEPVEVVVVVGWPGVPKLKVGVDILEGGRSQILQWRLMPNVCLTEPREINPGRVYGMQRDVGQVFIGGNARLAIPRRIKSSRRALGAARKEISRVALRLVFVVCSPKMRGAATRLGELRLGKLFQVCFQKVHRYLGGT